MRLLTLLAFAAMAFAAEPQGVAHKTTLSAADLQRLLGIRAWSIIIPDDAKSVTVDFEWHADGKLLKSSKAKVTAVPDDRLIQVTLQRKDDGFERIVFSGGNSSTSNEKYPENWGNGFTQSIDDTPKADKEGVVLMRLKAVKAARDPANPLNEGKELGEFIIRAIFNK